MKVNKFQIIELKLGSEIYIYNSLTQYISVIQDKEKRIKYSLIWMVINKNIFIIPSAGIESLTHVLVRRVLFTSVKDVLILKKYN